MELLDFDEANIVARLAQMPAQRRAAFAAACAQRLLPAYSRFASMTGMGDSEGVRSSLESIWKDLVGERILSEEEVSEAITSCTDRIPTEESPGWVPEQAVAEDAATAVVYALRCLKNGEAQEAAWAARCAYEAIDHYVINHENIDLNTPGAEALIISHPLIQAEMARQRRDLDQLLHQEVRPIQLWKRSEAESARFLPING